MTVVALVLAVVLLVAGAAAGWLATAAMHNRLSPDGSLGVRTEQTLSEDVLFTTANRVAAPGMYAAAAVLVLGAAANIVSGLIHTNVLVAAVITVISVLAAVLLAGYGGLQGARAASMQSRLLVGNSGSCATAATGGCASCSLSGLCSSSSAAVS